MVGNTNMDPIVDVELNVNGEKIELNNFVRSFILETVLGMVKSLRGVDEVESLKLELSKQTKKSQSFALSVA
ncbi:MAG: hypothetical protein ACYS5F_14350 [Planctomycetota bacterium]|jgi:hypothetical protein